MILFMIVAMTFKAHLQIIRIYSSECITQIFHLLTEYLNPSLNIAIEFQLCTSQTYLYPIELRKIRYSIGRQVLNHGVFHSTMSAIR